MTIPECPRNPDPWGHQYDTESGRCVWCGEDEPAYDPDEVRREFKGRQKGNPDDANYFIPQQGW